MISPAKHERSSDCSDPKLLNCVHLHSQFKLSYSIGWTSTQCARKVIGCINFAPTLTNFSSLCEDEVWHLSLCLYFRLSPWNPVSTLDKITIPKTTIATIKGEFQSIHKASVSLFQTEFVYFRYFTSLLKVWVCNVFLSISLSIIRFYSPYPWSLLQ